MNVLQVKCKNVGRAYGLKNETVANRCSKGRKIAYAFFLNGGFYRDRRVTHCLVSYVIFDYGELG